MRSRLTVALLILFGVLQQVHGQEAYFDSNGVKIRYVKAGRGETVILLHGFAVPSLEFMWIKNPLNEPKVFPELAKDFQVVAIDLRGHGKSGKPLDEKQYGLEMVEDVVRLMDHLKVQQAHVVGYSLGSIIAGKLLVTHPDRLLSVTFGAGAPLFQPSKPSVERAEQLVESLNKGQGAGPLVPLILPADDPPPSKEQADLIGKVLVQGQNQKALAAVMLGMRALEVTEQELQASEIPILMIYGNREGEARERIDKVAQILKPARTEVIAGADHLNTFATAKFRTTIRTFLKSQSAKPKVKP